MPAAALPPPDAYRFWSELRDGVPQPAGEAQLAYDVGDIPPGGESVVVLEIIVRSVHDYGADLVLVARPDQHEYARITFHGTLAEGASPVGVKLFREQPAGASVTYGLAILNYTGAPFDAVRVDLSPGSGVRLEGTTDWRLTSASPRLVADFGPLAADTSVERTFTIVPASGDCVAAQPVLVVTATQGDQVFHAAAIDDGVLLNCGGGEGGGDGVSAFPSAGVGPPPDRHEGDAAEAALLAGGAGALALGLVLRRRARLQAVPGR
jgi:hypothetical protein